MLTTVLLGILAILSHNVRGQIDDFQEIESDIFPEDSYGKEDNYYEPDFQYDNIWVEMERKAQQFFLDDYQYGDDAEKFKDVRGIPSQSHKGVSCLEKLDGPFYTIEGTSSDEHIYPARYFNISCVPASEMSLHHGHFKKMLPVKCEAGKRTCVTTIKEVPVFRKQLKSYNKNCWKPEKLIPVETGCKCVHF